MTEAKPRRIRIRVIAGGILILMMRLLTDNQSVTLAKTVETQLFEAAQCFDAANTYTENWTEAENDVYDAVLQIEAALTPNTSSPTLSYASAGLETALGVWREV